MIVILEGIDRVGKTTIAESLRDNLGFEIFKKERTEIKGVPNLIDESVAEGIINYGNALGLVDMFNWDGFDKNIVVDRFHWTEAIYSRIDRKQFQPMKYMGYVELKMLEKKEKYLMVYVRPTDINYSSRMHGSDLSKHLEEFERLYAHSSLPKYMTTFYSKDLVVKEVERRLKECQDQIN
jgi:thymidylate kinase